MPTADWLTFGSFTALMLAVAMFDSSLAKWVIGAVAVTLLIKHPDIIRNPFK